MIQIVTQSLTAAAPHTQRTNYSLTAAHINASSLALLNAASFPTLGVVCAVAIGRLKDSKELVIDPSEEELRDLDGGGTFAFIYQSQVDSMDMDEEGESQSRPTLSGRLVWSSWMALPFEENDLTLGTALAEEACRKVWVEIKNAVARTIDRSNPSQ